MIPINNPDYSGFSDKEIVRFLKSVKNCCLTAEKSGNCRGCAWSPGSYAVCPFLEPPATWEIPEILKLYRSE